MQSIYDIEVTNIQGKQQKLADFAGKILLFVNTASACDLPDNIKI